MLWENLRKDLIFIDLEAADSDEVFEKMGGALTRSGCCKDSFVDALKSRERTFPTGLQTERIGVAIPHADPEHVNNSTVSIATLKTPVTFYHMGTNPSENEQVQVRFVIMLAVSGKNHMDMLQQSIQLIQNQEILDLLTEAKTEDSVIKIIRDKEEQENENI